jgi:hypothetical protein
MRTDQAPTPQDTAEVAMRMLEDHGALACFVEDGISLELIRSVIASVVSEHERMLLRQVHLKVEHSGSQVPQNGTGDQGGPQPPALIKPTDDGRLVFTPRKLR